MRATPPGRVGVSPDAAGRFPAPESSDDAG
jgi:hypothetical protein